MRYVATFLLACVACKDPLTPAEQQEIGKDAALIAYCEQVGRVYKADGGTGSECYGEYDACMTDAGLR